MHALADKVALTQRQSASNGRPRTRRPHWIQRIHVKAQVYRGVADILECHLHDLSDTMSIHVVHAKRLDAILPEDLLLAEINVSEADIDKLLGVDPMLLSEPPEDIRVLPWGFCEPREKRHGHAVNIPASGGMWRVDIGVGVNPYHGDLLPEPLPNRLRSPADASNRNAVVPTEREH